MAAAAHNPAFAKKVGIPTKVAKEFNQADKGKKFKEGGMALFKGKETPAEERKEAKAVKSGKITPAQYAKGEAKEGHGAGAMAKGKALKSGKLSTEKYVKEHKYAEGGSVGKSNKAMPESKSMGTLGLKKGGKCCSKYARGGGVEVRGKTKGRMI